jgi:DNA primase
MTILEIYQAEGYMSKRVATTGGGEWAGPCPWCGGKDRFRLWPHQAQGGKFWCRGCGQGGDAIQYLRERRGLSFQEAVAHLGLAPMPASCRPPASKPAWEPRVCEDPAARWQAQARKLVGEAIHHLWGPGGQAARSFLQERGLAAATIRAFSLGWLAEDRWCAASEWGVSEVLKDNGQPKKFWMPAGLCIPMMHDGAVLRVRVRRPQGEPRYYVLRGSSGAAMIVGKINTVAVVVEAELDAVLLHQEAGDLVAVVALGNSSSRPDVAAAELLGRARLILVALDADRAGAREAWGWWREHYAQARRWPPVQGKDPGEMQAAGVDLRLWVRAGLAEYGS